MARKHIQDNQSLSGLNKIEEHPALVPLHTRHARLLDRQGAINTQANQLRARIQALQAEAAQSLAQGQDAQATALQGALRDVVSQLAQAESEAAMITQALPSLADLIEDATATARAEVNAAILIQAAEPFQRLCQAVALLLEAEGELAVLRDKQARFGGGPATLPAFALPAAIADRTIGPRIQAMQKDFTARLAAVKRS